MSPPVIDLCAVGLCMERASHVVRIDKVKPWRRPRFLCDKHTEELRVKSKAAGVDADLAHVLMPIGAPQ